MEHRIHLTDVSRTVRVGVTVTFMRMDRPPTDMPPGLPRGTSLVHAREPTVAFYRYLYDTVGGPYLWWLRRAAADISIAALLAAPEVSIHVLYRDGAPAGFFELDGRSAPDMILSKVDLPAPLGPSRP